MSPSPSTAPAGWFPDPADTAKQRYWDGYAWTPHTAPVATTTASTSPPPAPTSSGRPKKRTTPKWMWIIVAVIAIGIGVLLSPIFAVIFFTILVTGIVALIRHQPTWLRFRDRKVATWVTAVAAVGFLLTGSVANIVLNGQRQDEPVAFADVPTPSAPSTIDAAEATPTPTPTPSAVAVEVISVTDGDTIVTSAGKVRLIGIDAPEQGAWGYAEATDVLHDFLGSGTVTLVAVDGRDDTDKYNRLLRYVRVDGKDAGAHLLRTGWAIARYDDRDNYGWHPLQEKYISLDQATEMPAEPDPEPAPPPKSEPETDPRFGTCKEAIANGYSNYYKGSDPEYHWYQDRDGDGVVCET